jgi:hypothetical protein
MDAVDDAEVEYFVALAASYARFKIDYDNAVHGNGASNFDVWLRRFRDTLGYVVTCTPIEKPWLTRMQASQPSWRQVQASAQTPGDVTVMQKRQVTRHFHKLIALGETHPVLGCMCDGVNGEVLQLFMVASWLQTEAVGPGGDVFSLLDYVVLENMIPDDIGTQLLRSDQTLPFIVQMWGKWHVVVSRRRVAFDHVSQCVFFWLYLVWRGTDGLLLGKFDARRLLASVFDPMYGVQHDVVDENDMLARDGMLALVGMGGDE